MAVRVRGRRQIVVLIGIALVSACSNGPAAAPDPSTKPQPAVSTPTSTPTIPVNPSPTSQPPTPAETPSPTDTPTAQALSAPRGVPKLVRIVQDGKVILDKEIGGPIGYPPDDILNPPTNDVYWYRDGTWPMPGYPGPSVLVAHVTFKGQKGAFWDVGSAKPGDSVIVVYDSGDQVAFQVTEPLQHVPKTDLPRDRIWNTTTDPVLRLVTCDTATQVSAGHFTGNLVLYADRRVS